MQGEPIMLVVPESDALTVEARIAPQDIDQVYLAQSTSLRFSAFNQRTTAQLSGSISRISADVTQDQKNGTSPMLIEGAMTGDIFFHSVCHGQYG